MGSWCRTPTALRALCDDEEEEAEERKKKKEGSRLPHWEDTTLMTAAKTPGFILYKTDYRTSRLSVPP